MPCTWPHDCRKSPAQAKATALSTATGVKASTNLLKLQLCWHYCWLIQETNIIHNYATHYFRIITNDSFGPQFNSWSSNAYFNHSIYWRFYHHTTYSNPNLSLVGINTICYILPKFAKSIILDRGMETAAEQTINEFYGPICAHSHKQNAVGILVASGWAVKVHPEKNLSSLKL